jgi:hypothetical protein
MVFCYNKKWTKAPGIFKGHPGSVNTAENERVVGDEVM